jgi:hypothetical protein
MFMIICFCSFKDADKKSSGRAGVAHGSTGYCPPGPAGSLFGTNTGPAGLSVVAGVAGVLCAWLGGMRAGVVYGAVGRAIGS